MGLMTLGGELLAIGSSLANHADCCCGETAKCTAEFTPTLTISGVENGNCDCSGVNGTYAFSAVVLRTIITTYCGYDLHDTLSGHICCWGGTDGISPLTNLCFGGDYAFFLMLLNDNSYIAVLQIGADVSPAADPVDDSSFAVFIKEYPSLPALPITFTGSDLIAHSPGNTDCSYNASADTSDGACDWASGTYTIT